MPSNCLSSFSSNRDNFGVFSAGGIVNIWGCREDNASKLTSSTVLPHHLEAVCTCFAWSPIDQRQGASSKSSTSGELLAYGSSSGSVFIFNALSSSVIALPDNGHTGSVSSVAWHPNGTVLYSAADDGFLIEWNIKGNKLLRRWRCPCNDGSRARGGYTALALSSGSDQKLVAARQQIDVWDLSAGRVTNSFVGHSSDILSLLPVVCYEKDKDEKNSYVLSVAKNDRVMYAWRLDGLTAKPSVEQSSPCAAFLLPDGAASAKASFHIDSHTAHIFVVLLNGCIAAYRHVLNGKKIREPIRHAALIEIVVTGSNKRLPIVDMSLVSGADMMTIAYGEVSRPQFESFDMKAHWNEKNVKISREIQAVKSKEVPVDGSKQGAIGKFHVATANPALSVKSGSKRTLGETLSGGTKEVSANSVLAQGLLSRDTRILDSVLGGPGADPVAKRNSENQKHIESALDSLDNGLLLTLLDELTTRLATGHPAASQIAIRWLAVLLRLRGSRLASANATGGTSVNSAVSSKLAYLRDTLITRTLDSSRVLQLRGRLRMLREMASPSDNSDTTMAAKKQNNRALESNPTKVGPTVATAEASKPRLPFVLRAADMSSSDDDDETGEDSDSAMEDVKVKRGKQRKAKEAASSDESDASSEVDLASEGEEEDLPNGERDDRLNGSADEDEEDGGPTTENGFNHDNSDDEGEMMDYEMDSSDEDISSKTKSNKLNDKNKITNGNTANQKLNGKVKKSSEKHTKIEASPLKKSKKLRA